MIKDIFTNASSHAYIKKHQLSKQFHKAVLKILAGDNSGVDLKKRNPKSENIWSFRITKKYRAFAQKEGDVLFVHEIDDHQ